MAMNDETDLQERIAALKAEHRDLDERIDELVLAKPFDQIHLQRLKKRKLSIKDKISRLEAAIVPDIIA